MFKTLIKSSALLAGVAGVLLAAVSVAPAQAAAHSAMWQDCHAERLVDHRGAVGPLRKGPNEDTIASFAAAIKNAKQHPGFNGMEFETDLQPDKDGTIFNMHDSTLNRTTNKTGKVISASDYKMYHALTAAHEHVPNLMAVLNFMIANPGTQAQLEGKVYGSNWSDTSIHRLVHQIVSHGLLDRVHFASANLNWLERVNAEITAEGQTPVNKFQYIGFYNIQPSLAKAITSGLAIQLNVTYIAAKAGYGGSSTPYITQGQKLGFDVSTRASGNGSGDNGSTWTWEINHHAVQIVTNSAPTYYAWCNGR